MVAQGVRAATLYSALPVDSLFVWDEMPLRVSLGFRTTSRHGTFLRSSSQVNSASDPVLNENQKIRIMLLVFSVSLQSSASEHDLQLSLADGYVVLNSDNYTLKSDKRYSEGSWHYLSAVTRPTG